MSMSDEGEYMPPAAASKAKHYSLHCATGRCYTSTSSQLPRHLFRLSRKGGLVYGYWETKTGRIVAFNRRYRPMFEKDRGDEDWRPANENERIADIVKPTFARAIK